MSNKGAVLVTILNFNGWEETLPCVDSVLNQTYDNFHILLIDNGSADESIEKLAHLEKNERITFHKEPVNLGFDGGVNIGIRHAIKHEYEYTVLLNNDAILSDNWIEKLVGKITEVNASSITGLLLKDHGAKIESTADAYTMWGLPYPRQRDEPVNNAYKSGFILGGTAGASLYRTSLFKDVGLFDEKFFAYFEDTDLSLRSQLLGHVSYYEKTAVAYHEHGTTSGKMPGFTVYQTFKNLPLAFWKNIPAQLLLPIGLRFYFIFTLLYIRAVLRGQFWIATKGLVKGWILLPHAFSERRKIQSKRTLPIEEFKAKLYPGIPPSNKEYVDKLIKKLKR